MSRVCFCSGPKNCRDISCSIVRDYMRKMGIKEFTDLEKFDIQPIYDQ